MSGGLRRCLADLACRTLQATLPRSLQPWGWAVRCETAGIPDDTKALLFALDSLRGLLPRAIALHLLQPFTSLIGGGADFSRGSTIMSFYDATMRRPRAVGIVCSIGAVTLGLAYMAIAGAPARYLTVNFGALIIGLTMLALLGRAKPAGRQWEGRAITAAAGVLLATPLLGESVDGVTRWVRLGGLPIQPSLILLPAMLVAFARHRSALLTAGVIAAAAAMAIQPDRAMSGMLAVGLAVLVITRPDRHVSTAFGASIFGFAASLFRSDTLSAAPYVDQILYSSFEVHAAAGMAVLCGSALLLVPAIVGWSRDPANRATYAAFGAAWFAAIMAASLGNYPTPIVGYGGSAIIGYALSLLALPKVAGAHEGAVSPAPDEADATPLDRHMLVGLA